MKGIRILFLEHCINKHVRHGWTFIALTASTFYIIVIIDRTSNYFIYILIICKILGEIKLNLCNLLN